ncbi:MAG: sorbosone dehydrogenase, partial [Mesorhizobium sp.]
MDLPLTIAMPAEAAAAPKSYRLLIDGKFIDARDGRTLERNSPGHGFAVSRYAQAGAAEVEAAVRAAHKAF